MVVLGTAFGDIVGWDPRAPNDSNPSFVLRNGLRDGVQTALAVSPVEDQAWVVSGSSSGLVTCWDLRFRLPIVKIRHPNEARIRSLEARPGGAVWAAVQGNNEVALWSMEGRCRRKALWASPTKPLTSPASKNSNSVTSFFVLSDDNSSVDQAVITAGSDRRIRFWDLSHPRMSTIVTGAGAELISSPQLSYDVDLVDGVEVTVENYDVRPVETKSKETNKETPTSNSPRIENHNRPGLEPPALGHHDWISSLAICQGSVNGNWYVISGSRDGVIKVWL